jgi:bifunctional non-homologous end joining protein LigD
MAGDLSDYQSKRNFERTPEPVGGGKDTRSALRFVVQKHAASHLHYDFRLEWAGVLKSWAVPKGPSLNPKDKRLAVQVEDHPVEYASFEGAIPEGEYGAGTVMVWDFGTWEPAGDVEQMFAKGSLKFFLHGERLKGKWALVQIKKDPKSWLLIKEHDEEARTDDDPDILTENTVSALTGRTMEEIAAGVQGGAMRRARELVESLPQTREAEQPRQLSPQLAVPATVPPEGSDFLNEIKYDGFRILAFIEDGVVRLVSRKGNDYTRGFQRIADALERFGFSNAILDGEVVVVRQDGTHDFAAVHTAAAGGSVGPLVYYVFDLPFFAGYDLRAVPLNDRKSVLEMALSARREECVRYSEHIVGSAPAMFEEVCRLGLEGILCKRKDSKYTSKRTADWLKIKCSNVQEFLVCGYTAPEGTRHGFGALVLGRYDDEDIVYVGRVGSGFTDEQLSEYYAKFQAIRSDKPTALNPSKETLAKGVQWIEPRHIAKVRFARWTDDGTLREPTFLSLRENEDPPPTATDNPGNDATVAGVRLSNPDRALWPEAGVTKRKLAEYLLAVWERMAPHLLGRPVSLVRCPDGWQGEQFYQKHLNLKEIPPGIQTVEIVEEGEDKGAFPVVTAPEGMVQLAQLNVLEVHPWGATVVDLDRPDRLIFDIDPGPEVAWQRVVECAHLLRAFLKELGVECWVKTTGGKGLHVVAPLKPEREWEAVGRFASAVAARFATVAPQLYTTKSAKDARVGKVYIDTLRNRRGATCVAPYSPRARSGAPVSTPVSWEELGDLPEGGGFAIGNLAKRLEQGDPWEGFLAGAQVLQTSAFEALGIEP